MIQAVETTPATDGGDVLFIDVIGDKSELDTGHLLTSVLWDMTPVLHRDDSRTCATTPSARELCHLAGRRQACGLLETPQIPEDVLVGDHGPARAGGLRRDRGRGRCSRRPKSGRCRVTERPPPANERGADARPRPAASASRGSSRAPSDGRGLVTDSIAHRDPDAAGAAVPDRRDVGDHQAVPRHRRQRPHRPGASAGRGARAARRERRRQVDP